VNVPVEFDGALPGRRRALAQWGPRYLDAHYALDSVVEISGYGTSTYQWNVPAGTRTPVVPDYVLLFRRTDEPRS
jgi:hypothetical protein